MSATDLSPIASMRINRWLIGGKKQHHFMRQQCARTIYTHVCAWDESDWVNVGRWSIVIIRNPITNQSCHPKATASSLLSSWLHTSFCAAMLWPWFRVFRFQFSSNELVRLWFSNFTHRQSCGLNSHKSHSLLQIHCFTVLEQPRLYMEHNGQHRPPSTWRYVAGDDDKQANAFHCP